MKRIVAMLTMKCPRCMQGNLFYNRNPFSFRQIGSMPDECPNCQQDFVIEPGFWYGAMFVSYALTAMMLLIPMGIGILVLGSITWNFLIACIAAIVVLYIYIFKVSRSIYIHIVVLLENIDWN